MHLAILHSTPVKLAEQFPWFRGLRGRFDPPLISEVGPTVLNFARETQAFRMAAKLVPQSFRLNFWFRKRRFISDSVWGGILFWCSLSFLLGIASDSTYLPYPRYSVRPTWRMYKALYNIETYGEYRHDSDTWWWQSAARIALRRVLG